MMGKPKTPLCEATACVVSHRAVAAITRGAATSTHSTLSMQQHAHVLLGTKQLCL